MEIIIKTSLLVLFIGINIGFARYDAYRIKNHIRIRHAINALVYLGFMLLVYKWLTIYSALAILLIRIPVFNTALNIFRGKPANWLSYTTTSIITQATNGIVEKIGYWTYNILLILISIILLYI